MTQQQFKRYGAGLCARKKAPSVSLPSGRGNVVARRASCLQEPLIK